MAAIKHHFYDIVFLLAKYYSVNWGKMPEFHNLFSFVLTALVLPSMVRYVFLI